MIEEFTQKLALPNPSIAKASCGLQDLKQTRALHASISSIEPTTNFTKVLQAFHL